MFSDIVEEDEVLLKVLVHIEKLSDYSNPSKKSLVYLFQYY